MLKRQICRQMTDTRQTEIQINGLIGKETDRKTDSHSLADRQMDRHVTSNIK
jgi:hypothetical protein